MARSEMWARSGQKDLERLAPGVGPPSHGQGNRSAVFAADSEWSHFDVSKGKASYTNKANLASAPRPKPTTGQCQGEARRLAVTTHRDGRRKAGVTALLCTTSVAPSLGAIPCAVPLPRPGSCPPLSASFTRVAEHLPCARHSTG